MILALLLSLAQTTAPAAFDTLLLEAPSQTPHGTLLVEERWEPKPSPFVLVDEDGTQLYTQWDRVLSFAAGDVVELTGWSPEPVEGLLRVRRLDDDELGQSRRGLALFDADAIGILAGLTPIRLQVDDEPPVTIEPPWTWVHRLGPCRITVGRQVSLGRFDAIVWADVRAGSSQVALAVTLHNCRTPVRPDAYFGEVSVLEPDGYTSAPTLPDGSQTVLGLLVSPDPDGPHIIPRLYRRPFRLAVLPEADEAPEFDGWGTTRWNRVPKGAQDRFQRLGGFLPHSISVPDLSHTQPRFLADYLRASDALLAGAADPLRPGALPPPSVLWPTRGVRYGGSTGGIDISQHPGTDAAFFAEPTARTIWQIEQLRYAARQRGHLLGDDGSPPPFSSFLDPQGKLTVKLYNNGFQRRGDDGPLGYFAAEDGDDEGGDGLCAYEAQLAGWDPIDEQHLIRWLRSRLVLIWLDNDPVAREELIAQALDSMLAMHGRVRTAPAWGPGNGTTWGRGEAWAIDTVAAAYAVDQDPDKLDFLQRAVAHLEAAQMPSGLVSRLSSGKVVQNYPMGHYFVDQAGVPITLHCPIGLPHTGNVGDYDAARSNEQCYLLLAHRAARLIAGTGSVDFERRLCEGMRDLAWATDPDGSYRAGVLDRYPVAVKTSATQYGPVFRSRSDVARWDIIAGAGAWNATDAYQCGSVFGFSVDYGVAMPGPLRAYAGGARDLPGVLRWFEAQGLTWLDSRAATLEVLQRFR